MILVYFSCERSAALASMNIKIMVFWNVTPCILVDWYQVPCGISECHCREYQDNGLLGCDAV
jgi:hypothetical protein